MVEQRIATTQRRRIAYAALPELPAPDPGAGTHNPAATLDASTGDATGVQTATAPADLGVHPAATITPDQEDQPAVGGATTKPLTDIQPTDTDPNQPPLIIIDATPEDEL
jgi:hypothetical protein